MNNNDSERQIEIQIRHKHQTTTTATERVVRRLLIDELSHTTTVLLLTAVAANRFSYY